MLEAAEETEPYAGWERYAATVGPLGLEPGTF
jgi:hypothetical protein